MLSDLTNIEKVRDKLPEDKIKDLHFDADTLSVHTPVGDIKMRIVEREVPKTIKFASEESMVSFNFWIQLVAVDAQTSKMKLTIKPTSTLLSRVWWPNRCKKHRKDCRCVAAHPL